MQVIDFARASVVNSGKILPSGMKEFLQKCAKKFIFASAKFNTFSIPRESFLAALPRSS
jgi:hypothetical protein